MRAIVKEIINLHPQMSCNMFSDNNTVQAHVLLWPRRRLSINNNTNPN